MYLTIEFSQLMLKIYAVSYAGSFSCHAVNIHTLYEYFNICDKSVTLLQMPKQARQDVFGF